MLKPQAEQHQDSRKTHEADALERDKHPWYANGKASARGFVLKLCTPLSFRKHSWEKPIGVLASCKFPPQRHSALAQVDTAPADLSNSGNPKKIKRIEIPMFFQKKNVRRVLHVFNHLRSQKNGTRGFFSLDVCASGPDGFQTFRVEGCRRGGELTAIGVYFVI